jgi:hypothetical protein
MLASITPLGERGRRSRWSVTVSAFALGSTAAGVAAGAALGALGSLVLRALGPLVLRALGSLVLRALGPLALPADLSPKTRLGVLAAALAVAILLDALPRRVPGPRRQVDERWLDEYRGWVYGLGYGSQLGLAVTTVVSSAATYVALLAAFMAASATSGALMLGCFGAIRGVMPLAAAGVHSQRQLLALHRAVGRWRGRVRWGAVALQGATLIAALASAGAS